MSNSSQSWREPVGVRFTLLALVPAVSVLAIGAILSRGVDRRGRPGSKAVVEHGTAVLVIYVASVLAWLPAILLLSVAAPASPQM